MSLSELPRDFGATRSSLHAVAENVLAPARYAAVKRIGLRPTAGGFGTPEFDGKQISVRGIDLVVREGDSERIEPLSTIEAAQRLTGGPFPHPAVYDRSTDVDPKAPLALSEPAAEAVADVFAFGHEVLGRLRDESHPSEGASEIQLWPEHFDLAFEAGREDEGKRAGYGVSPGDSDHGGPYLYVVPWARRDDSYWNEPHFFGKALSHDQLIGTPDQVEVALAFFREARDRLRATG